MYLDGSGKQSITNTSNASYSEHPLNVQSVNSGSNSKNTGLLIDTAMKSGSEVHAPQTQTYGSRKSWASNSKASEQPFQKKKKSAAVGAQTKGAKKGAQIQNSLRLSGQGTTLKDLAKSHPVSQAASGCSTAKNLHQAKPPPATAQTSAVKGRQSDASNYYTREA